MRGLVCLTALSLSAPALTEPTGRWWSGFGQGTTEYGIKNDSAGSDSFYMVCAPDRTYVSLRIGGREPRKGETVTVTIGRDEFTLFLGENGYFETNSHVNHDTYLALWAAIREGADMRVRLATGQSTNFTLLGAAKILPREACATDFARF